MWANSYKSWYNYNVDMVFSSLTEVFSTEGMTILYLLVPHRAGSNEGEGVRRFYCHIIFLYG